MSKYRLKAIAFLTIPFLVSLVGYILVCETYIMLNERKMSDHLYSWRSFHTVDRHTGWALEPGAHGYVRTWNGLIYTSINELGVRNPPVLTSKKPDRTRILFLGDSFLYDNAFSREDTYAYQTQLRLGQQGCQAEIVNSGVNGYGTDQEFLYYKNRGRLLAPDICILNFYVGNDIHDNAAGIISERTGINPGKPYYTLSENSDDIIVHNYPYEGELVGSFVDPFNSPITIAGFAPFHLFGLKSLRLIETKLNQIWQSKISPLISDTGKDTKTGNVYDKYFGPLWINNPSDGWIDAIKITRLLIKSIKEQVEKDGGRFGIVIIPKKQQLEKQWLEHENRDPFVVENRLIPFFERENIPYINLYDSFKHVHNKYAALYEGGVHWNNGGHAVASFAVAHWLKDEFVINKSKKTGWRYD